MWLLCYIPFTLGKTRGTLLSSQLPKYFLVEKVLKFLMIAWKYYQTRSYSNTYVKTYALTSCSNFEECSYFQTPDRRCFNFIYVYEESLWDYREDLSAVMAYVTQVPTTRTFLVDSLGTAMQHLNYLSVSFVLLPKPTISNKFPDFSNYFNINIVLLCFC